MNKSELINEIALALSKFQSQAINPYKDKKGQNGTYADLSSVLDVSRPALAEFELAVTQMPFTGDGTIGVETMLLHSSGQWISSQIEVPLIIATNKDGRQIQSAPQAAGSVITYLRRYAITSVLGLAQDDDDAEVQISRKNYAESMTTQRITNAEIEVENSKIIETKTVEELQALIESMPVNMRSKVQQTKNSHYHWLTKEHDNVA